MIITKPKVHHDGLYNKKQAAEALHIDRHTVNRYEKRGMIEFKERLCGGKVTTGEAIVNCWEKRIENKI